MAVLTIPKVLREKLSDDGADALVDLINKADDKQKEDILRFLEEKFEVKLFSVEGKINSRISVVEEKISAKISILEEKFERRLSDVKAELIKWIFIFWAGQIAILTGIMLSIFKR